MAELNCPNCGGTGWQIVTENGVETARRCGCSRGGDSDKLFGSAKVPPRYFDCDFDNFIPDSRSAGQVKARSMAQKFALDYPVLDDELFSGGSLLFCGGSGRGKTHLAVAVMKVLLKKGVPCLFVDFHELLNEIRASYDEQTRTSEYQILRPILNVDVLLLDDLGSLRTTDWVQDTVFYIINWRYNHKKSLLATTNLNLEPLKTSDEALEHRLGYRVVSRLYEMCTVIELEGTDYRKEVRKAGSDTLRRRGD